MGFHMPGKMLLSIVLAITVLLSGWGAPRGPASHAEGSAVPGEVLIGWRSDVKPAEIQGRLDEWDATWIDAIEPLHVTRVRVHPGDEARFIAALRRDPLVAYAEPNYYVHAASIPNDPGYVQQWNMDIISAPAAWEVTTGSSGITVAIIDSGVDVAHPELQSRIVYGYDYIGGDTVPDDQNGHGTHVAGIIGAIGNNGQGVAGVTWSGPLLIYRVLDANGLGNIANVASAIVSAQARGARIINLSLTADTSSQTLLNAVQSAYSAGILLVAATGNTNGSVYYPAKYSQVMAVAATTHLDRHAWYSNRGPEVDIAAPGGLSEAPIYSTYPIQKSASRYGWLYGTSMAAAHVSGLAALIWSVDPTLSRDQVWQIIEDTADKVDAASHPYDANGRNDYLGHGRINVDRAVRSALQPQLQITPDALSFLTSTGRPQGSAVITLSNPSAQALGWSASVIAGTGWLSLDPPTSGGLAYPTTTTLTVRVNGQGKAPGTYWGMIRFTSDAGGQITQRDIWVQLQVIAASRYSFLPTIVTP